MREGRPVRQPLVEGLFYPAEKGELETLVTGFLAGEKGRSPALILPHASFSLIGEACGRAWMKSAGRPVKRVLVLAPVHREPEPGIFLPPYGGFASPLGEQILDDEILDRLEKASPLCRMDRAPFEEEHSLELMIPFMRTLFPGALLIPLLVGEIRRRERKALGPVIKEVFAPLAGELLTIITTNLSRFITPEVSLREADLFCRYLADESDLNGGEHREISACGVSCLDLFREAELYGGRFRELSRFEEVRKENRKPASVHYGTFFFEESGENPR